MRLNRILLIQPKGMTAEGFGGTVELHPDSRGMRFLTGTAAADRMSRDAGFKALFAPIPIASVAALTPRDIDVELWDEHIKGLVDDSGLDRGYDLVGITGFRLHRARAVEIARMLRRRRVPSAVGGPGASSEPHIYRGLFDHLFVGEAEITWPQFIRDFREGRPKAEYRQIEKPELGDVPLPRWDLVPNIGTDYLAVGVQTTRGCPFDCEFCDVISLFGRRPRHRPIGMVLEELVRLERMGANRVFISDDNFYGHPAYMKELLRQLILLNNSFRRPMAFMTQITINVAKDDEALELLADANFFKLLIGIESANPESLRETNKPQNYNTDMLADIRKIHSYGLAIHGQMIVGFDHDGPDVFERTFEFIQQSCIPTIIINVLYALPGTMLWHRLRREGRVLDVDAPDSLSFRSNVVFTTMSRAELYRGFVKLYQRVYEPENVRQRMQGMVEQIQRKPRVRIPPYWVTAWKWRRFSGNLLKLLLRLCRMPGFLRTRRTARQLAPVLGAKFMALWVQVLFLREFTRAMGPSYEAIIDYEEKHPPQPFEDHTVMVPPSFRKDYKGMFPSVYHRLSRRLGDTSKLNEALVEVFWSFIQRFHDEYDRLGEHRFVHLQEICDRTIAKINGEDPTTGSFPDAPPVQSVMRMTDEESKNVVREVRRIKLDDDILKAVEQELVRNGREVSPASHLVPLVAPAQSVAS